MEVIKEIYIYLNYLCTIKHCQNKKIYKHLLIDLKIKKLYLKHLYMIHKLNHK